MKTLYLGCSHSAGVWNDEEKIIDAVNSVPYLTSKIFNQSWKSISVLGHGVLTFASIVEHLIQQEKFNFDNLIVQQTFEPRISLVNEKLLFHVVDSYLNNDDDKTLKCQIPSYWSSYPRTEFEAKEHFFKNEKIEFMDYIEDIADQFNKGPKQGQYPDHIWIDMSYRFIKSMCDMHNVKFYSFAWDVSYRDTNYIRNVRNVKFGQQNNVRDWLKKHTAQYNNIITKTGQHPKKDAVNMISQQLGNALTEAGYK